MDGNRGGGCKNTKHTKAKYIFWENFKAKQIVMKEGNNKDSAY